MELIIHLCSPKFAEAWQQLETREGTIIEMLFSERGNQFPSIVPGWVQVAARNVGSNAHST